jgi:uncharacterized protein (DUF885 family)
MSEETIRRGPADDAFEALAHRTIEYILERHPEYATLLGDHRFDGRLTEPGPDAREAERRELSARARELEAVGPTDLSPVNRIDAQILGARLREQLFQLEELREHEWDPLVANPADAIYMLLARDYAPLPDRLEAVAGRLSAIPGNLAAARADLGEMPKVHVETAAMQFGGTIGLITEELDRSLEDAPGSTARIDAVRPAAVEALQEHIRWLQSRLSETDRDPRIGERLFATKLGLTLDAASDADALLARAEEDLVRKEAQLAEVAARLSGEPAGTPHMVRRMLDRLAQDHPTDDTIVAEATAAYEAARAFTETEGIATMYDDPIEIIVMPEFNRGIAVAYCDPPGPLETADVPTLFAISPTPDDWPAERVASFYREYNSHLIHELSIHEGVPGHMLQLGHWRRFRAPTLVRAAFPSGPFVEGWAVYSEDVMGEHGYRGDELAAERLKMDLRSIINTILDVRVHAHGMTEAEGMRLMLERGHQEEGEAVGKWRRALLTSTQLSTYYVGSSEVTDLAGDLRAARPELPERALHDLMLSQGCPAPRFLHSLLIED